MRRALSEYVVTGIRTNLVFHEKLLAHPEFVAGRYDTGFIDRYKQELLVDGYLPEGDHQAQAVAIALAAARLELQGAGVAQEEARTSAGLSPWTASHRARMFRS
jgi:acetyl-CoA carboxylase biotin carboxylase subunit